MRSATKRNPRQGHRLWYTPTRRAAQKLRAAGCAEIPGQVKSMSEEMKHVEAKVNPEIPEIRPGDTVSVHVRIKEGDRERVQEFRGTVIRLRKGGNNSNFTVRRLASHGVGVERTFLLRSPRIEKVEVQRQARVRRAQLYYLRDRTGKSARLDERRKEQAG
ncbi:MAG TPA: 50S ribosomal protein L19 [Anaerolineales bacterium]|nr:50S ribosomal protein L19 [Anaerolineales bacterium]